MNTAYSLETQTTPTIHTIRDGSRFLLMIAFVLLPLYKLQDPRVSARDATMATPDQVDYDKKVIASLLTQERLGNVHCADQWENLAALTPGLNVDGYGMVRLPMNERAATDLLSVSSAFRQSQQGLLKIIISLLCVCTCFSKISS